MAETQRQDQSAQRVRRALNHTRYVLINRMVMPLAAFLLLVLIGHQSDVLLGQYALVTTFYFIMQTLPLLGLTPYVMREVARRPEIAGTFYTTLGGLAVVSCLLINVGADWLAGLGPYSEAVRSGVRVVGFSIVPGILAFLAEITLISLDQARRVARIAVAENGLRLGVSAIVLWMGGGLVALMWVLFCTRTLAFLAYMLEIRYGVSIRLRLTPDLALLKQVFRVLPPFFFNSVLFLVGSRLDYVVLSLFESIERIGYYAVAYRLLEISLLVVSAFITAVYPWLARKFALSRTGFHSAVRLLFGSALLALIGGALAGYLVADDYVRILFSTQYPYPVELTRLFILVLVLVGLDLFMASVLNAMDLQRQDLIAMAAGSAVYAVALFTMVPTLHLHGALWATVLAAGVQLGMRVAIYWRRSGPLIGVREGVLSLLIGAALLALVWRGGEVDGTSLAGDLLLVAAGVVLYPLLLAVCGLLRPLRLLRMVWPRHMARSAGSLAGLLDHVVQDARRQSCVMANRADARYPGRGYHVGLGAVILYRLARYFHVRGKGLLARLAWQLNITIYKLDIPPDTVIGPGLVLESPSNVIVVGSLGRNVTLGASTGIGCDGRRDVGAGPGVPVIEDGAVLGAYCGVQGGLRIPQNCRLPAYSQVRGAADLRDSLRRREQVET